jgi:hypothetical protein
MKFGRQAGLGLCKGSTYPLPSVTVDVGSGFFSFKRGQSGALISGGLAKLRNRCSKLRKSINLIAARRLFQYSLRELNLERQSDYFSNTAETRAGWKIVENTEKRHRNRKGVARFQIPFQLSDK